MEHPLIRAKAREFVGKGFARKIRALGYLPAVLYGGEGEPRSLVVDGKAVTNVLNGKSGRNTIVNLSIEDEKSAEQTLAVVREFQVHPLKRNLEHCDFMRVGEDTELTVRVPVRVTGKSEGEKLGARLNLAMRQVNLRCKAGVVPDEIVIDVTSFKVGQVMTLSQLPLAEGARAVFVKDNAVVTLKMPRADKSATEEEEAEAAASETAAAEAPAAPAEEPKA
jgi:large subunit ribosomal protein L25